MSIFSMSYGAFAIAVMLGMVIVIALKARRMKRSQDDLMLKYAGKDGIWFRVNVSRPAYFAKRMKLLGFEAKGLLVHFPDRVMVVAETPSGEKIEKSYDKSSLNLQWLGNPGIASANMHWFSLGSQDATLMVSADTGFNALPSRETAADICRMIAPQFDLPASATSEFALEKNFASLAVVIGFFVLLGYALIDGVFLNKNEVLGLGGAIWGFPLCALLALPIYLGLARNGVPSRESLTLCALTGMAVMIAYIPALQRADQYLAADGAQPVAYRLKDDSKLEPLSPGPPPVNFRNVNEYWAQFESGSVHYLQLIHGPLGVWQLDHTQLDKDVAAFYATRPK